MIHHATQRYPGIKLIHNMIGVDEGRNVKVQGNVAFDNIILKCRRMLNDAQVNKDKILQGQHRIMTLGSFDHSLQ